MDAREEDDNRVLLRTIESLLTSLERNGSVLYSEDNSINVKKLLSSLERTFQHGLKPSKGYKGFFQGNENLCEELSWWTFLQEVLSKDEVERISKRLGSVNTEMGWARSWLRISLNEKSLRRTLACVEEETARAFYEPWALMRDSSDKLLELSGMMETRLKFALIADHPDLNQSSKQNDLEDFIVARATRETPKVAGSSLKKNKKRRNQVVCLDGPKEGSSRSRSKEEHSSTLMEPPTDTNSPLLYSPRLTPIKNVEIGTLTPIKYDTLHSSSECNTTSSETEEEEDAPAASGSSSEREELKSHLLSVLDSKEELTSQVSSLKLLLESENRKVASLRNELEALRRSSRERGEKKEVRLGLLSRENELLKHQLKKYVGAVQRLQDGPLINNTVMESSRDLHSSNQQSQYIDYHYEASEYEKKLVQVAEMHGELLEFNEHLQKCLNNKDVLLRRYIDELELLRGPIELEAPEDTSEDVLSVDSLPATRPLISIWIPSVFLSGKYNNSSSAPSCTPTPSSKHHVYQVYLRIRDEEWNVYRRYSEFHALNKHLKKAESTVGSFDFPPKKSLGHRTDKVVEDRRARLQVYLRRVIHLMLKKNSSLADSPSKSTLTRLLPFFEEHRVSRDFDPEDLGDFRREDSHIVEEAVPQLAL